MNFANCRKLVGEQILIIKTDRNMYKLQLTELNSVLTKRHNVTLYYINADLNPSKYEDLTDNFFTIVVDEKGNINEFPSVDLDHLFSNLSDCGVPSYIIHSLVEFEMRTNIPSKESDWKRVAKKIIKKSELDCMEYHEFVYTYSSFLTMDEYGYKNYIKKSLK